MADKTVSTKTKTGVEVKIDDALFSDIKDHAKQMQSDDRLRDIMFSDIDKMYLMQWQGSSGKKSSKAQITISPDARNTVLGAVRLMVATDPQINIKNVSNKFDQTKVDNLEKAANRIWEVAGRAQGNPVHYDALLSAILYSEMHLAITSTNDLLEAAKKNGEGVDRAQQLADRTPFLIESWNPKDGHAEYDQLGLSGYYRQVDTTVQKLKSSFGGLLPQATLNRKTYAVLKLNTFYDNTNVCIWTDDGPIMLESHNLSSIPVVVQQTEGSRLWSKSEESHQPLLYTLLKSGLWEMENLILTVMYTTIKDMGFTPLYIHKQGKNGVGKPLEMNFDEHPAIIELENDEDFAPITNKGLIDPAIENARQIAEQKSEQSTIYSQALGAPIEGTSTYSELALLSQSGRLPLVGIQRRGGWGISSVIEMCLHRMKTDNTIYKSNGIELKPADIPDFFEAEAKLEVSLPQDKLQLANIATTLTAGDEPQTSHKWTRENILNIGQSADMDKEIWTEKATYAQFQLFLQQQMQQQQLANQQQVVQQQQGMNQQPQSGGQGITLSDQSTTQQSPEQIAASQMPGQETTGGLPQVQAGIMPGAGNMAIPGGGQNGQQ